MKTSPFDLTKERPLDKEIVSALSNKIGKSESTVRKDISIMRSRFGSLPINTVAHIYALENQTSVRSKLTKYERKKLPHLDIEKPPKLIQKKLKIRERIKLREYIKYETINPFIKDHVDEVDRAYTFHCYTSAFILCRKIIENLLIDIIRKKYPKIEKKHVEMYFDTTQGRMKDFSIIIKNLRERARDFDPDCKLLERILTKSEKFKGDANDKTHSWYHILKISKELDEKDVQGILNMIKILENQIEKKQ